MKNKTGSALPLGIDILLEANIFRSWKYFRSRSRIFALLLFLASLVQAMGACAPFSPAARDPRATAPVPSAYTMQDTVSDPHKRWWEEFGDAELNGFVEEALSGNQNLAVYWARLGKAEALALRAGADLIPSLDGEAAASYAKNHGNESPSGRNSENDNYSLGLVASYEVDLWGRIRAEKQSAKFSVAASREDLNSTAITLAAAVGDRWARIIEQRQQKLLLQKQLAANETYLELVELRFRKSLASALDVMQQKQLVERVKAQMPLIELEERLQLNELAVLLGRLPYDAPSFKRDSLPDVDTPPAAGIPAELLEFRPDILAAYNRLAAADLDLAAARADRLPALRLTGAAAYSSGELDTLFDNWMLNLAAGLTAPLIDGGRRKADVLYGEAFVQEQLAEYMQTVLTAVREVEDALIREDKIRQNIQGLEKQLEAARTALEEAGFRYTNGLIDYLPVLTQLLSVQNLELDLIARKTDLLIARMDLYRAIGGTWTGEMEPPEQDNISRTGYSINE